MPTNFLCPNCNAENPVNYEFCGTCGAKLAGGERETAIECSACGWQNSPGQRFCGRCGARLNIPCPNCGVTLPSDSRYCPNCAYLCGEGRYGSA